MGWGEADGGHRQDLGPCPETRAEVLQAWELWALKTESSLPFPTRVACDLSRNLGYFRPYPLVSTAPLCHPQPHQGLPTSLASGSVNFPMNLATLIPGPVGTLCLCPGGSKGQCSSTCVRAGYWRGAVVCSGLPEHRSI